MKYEYRVVNRDGGWAGNERLVHLTKEAAREDRDACDQFLVTGPHRIQRRPANQWEDVA